LSSVFCFKNDLEKQQVAFLTRPVLHGCPHPGKVSTQAC